MNPSIEQSIEATSARTS